MSIKVKVFTVHSHLRTELLAAVEWGSHAIACRRII